ncbi:hypothetical protein GCM10010211_58100 [Streptomyces albospinus]|uniref:Secreted protein n=1 Tax=Streptomyces albospinus TaxID=285515 RepID=A0ABQ2VFI8_9ACTN|nr:hypothetical protein [Streptomyces albospinus]GGU84506.1 hypothetical protein GCM10010211_58100 [Streptomyces albospinus]
MRKINYLLATGAAVLALTLTGGVAAAAENTAGQVTAPATTAGGPPGWGYIASYPSPQDCQNAGDSGKAAGQWPDFVCVQSDSLTQWELWVP